MNLPNKLSLMRVIMVPLFVAVMVIPETVLPDVWSRILSAAIFILTAFTDFLDGMIARKFNMVSDLGKVLDPFCDKLTQLALLICLITRYPDIWRLLVLLVAKELIVATLGAIAVKRNERYHSARWYGKLCTVVFESAMIVLMLFPDIPWSWVIAIIALCSTVMVFAMVMYMIFFIRLIVGKRAE